MTVAVDTEQKATVTKRIGVTVTEYIITGALEAVLEEVKSVFSNYDGRGYGTHLGQMEVLADGSYGARMSRMNSCD